MSNTSAVAAAIFRDEFIVPATAIDANGHVNNVVFVQWMQDVATRHFESAGCAEAMRNASAIWVVRSHTIEYLGPAFAGDRLRANTWVVNFSRVRSLRRYQFARASDGKLLVRRETDWVLVNAATGRPCSIPESIQRAFVLVDEAAGVWQGTTPRPDSPATGSGAR
ncbi:MAG TPA: thioesterase family protein [Methylomirabilota bacterium]|nr:thioesterase family protein [Methylomirabilota bacterium]